MNFFDQLFIEYGKLALSEASGRDNGSSKPFQKIMFLVRDWGLLEGIQYGLDGGQEYLNAQLEGSDASEELIPERKNLKADRCLIQEIQLQQTQHLMGN